ncbi:hypothetical protein L202_00073 [Cryptococcus amylolentus CBS 6039]|uniref:N-acetylglucosaminylphosphatidylinositol deacetylase n=1 Tax=Cryptococcus amylolentus CBS 6039 TaxID=1295533 RepID=A0A1E3I881_9TREE|nr:hypothetical protein L202_00073 [Cryptococcus amylolentus CBS 6039]ODN84046.1 hypothetical protein L202_00073 [Cryptococcus amylolentus CBS 6039]
MPPRTAPTPRAVPPSAPRMSTPMLFAVLIPICRLFLLFTPLPQPSSLNLQRPFAPSSPIALRDEEGKVDASWKPKALVVTAHPDDEAMFFAPTVHGLGLAGWDVSALCLSNGNGDGLGHLRKDELYAGYKTLGVAEDHVTLIDNPDLQDSITTEWDPALVASFISDSISANPVDLIITFDGQGVTSHPNHKSIPAAISHLSPASRPRVVALKSPETVAKFTGPLHIIYLHLKSIPCLPIFQTNPAAQAVLSQVLAMLNLSSEEQQGLCTAETHVLVNDVRGWVTGIKAMREHKSQMVWFRYLYLLGSRLMWVNELEEVKV